MAVSRNGTGKAAGKNGDGVLLHRCAVYACAELRRHYCSAALAVNLRLIRSAQTAGIDKIKRRRLNLARIEIVPLEKASLLRSDLTPQQYGKDANVLRQKIPA